MIINGGDYTIVAVGIIFVVLLFLIQLALCFKTKHLAVKLIPMYFIFALFILAVLVATSNNVGSFLDLSLLVAVIILCFALVCGISIGGAWLIYKFKRRKPHE